jgi:hypothetical protein
MRNLQTRFSTCREDSIQRRRWFGISYHLYCSDLVHLEAHSVVPWVSQLCNHPTRLPTPCSGMITCNTCHRIDNTSLLHLESFFLWQRGISARKLKIYTIDGWMYCAKRECNRMIVAPQRDQHPSSGANTPSDIAVTVHFNAEYNQIPVNQLNSFQRITSLSIVMVYGLAQSPLHVSFLSNPSMVTRVGVYLACCLIYM